MSCRTVARMLSVCAAKPAGSSSCAEVTTSLAGGAGALRGSREGDRVEARWAMALSVCARLSSLRRGREALISRGE